MTTRPRSRPMDEASSYNPGLIARELIQMSNKSWPFLSGHPGSRLNFSTRGDRSVDRSIGRSAEEQSDRFD